MLFFGVTGVMLNHEDWFGLDEPRLSITEGETAKELLAGPDKLLIVEHLRSKFGVVGRMEAFDTEEEELRVTFKKPGLEIEVVIQREDGATTVTSDSRGIAGW